VNPAALTAVLPLRMDAQKTTSDLDRVERLLLPSFERFWRGPDRLEFLVVVPPGDVGHVKARVAVGRAFPMRVLSEDLVCPTLAGHLGWHKQQILKLAAAKIVATPWYLTLDADVMLRRAASPDDLVRAGKAVFHAKRAARHWEWWTASQTILRSAVQLGPDMEMMDVTPEILHRDTALELLAEIGRRNEAVEPERFLFENRAVGWTEYSLYWLFVVERQLQDQLYRAGGPLYEMAWRPEHVAPLAQRWGDDDGKALFCILQSTLEIPIQEVEDLMRRSPTGTSPSRTNG
jgi:uncharacterized protein DUF6492